MRTIEIEHWALTVIEQVELGQPNEDTRVELKSDWIDPSKAARQVAGHANASRGDPILWLVGVNQENGVTGVAHIELASWLPQVVSHFDGLAPEAVDLNIPHDGMTVVALFFLTDRAPYVVKNPEFGVTRGHVISLETPWREGTTTRSAKRSELVRILVPRLSLPDVEVLSAELTLAHHDKYRWDLEINFYISPVIGEMLVIPNHRCKADILVSPLGLSFDLSEIRISPPYKGVVGGRTFNKEPDSITAAHTRDDVLVQGPARLILRAGKWADAPEDPLEGMSATARVSLNPVHASRPTKIECTMDWVPEPRDRVIAQWEL